MYPNDGKLEKNVLAFIGSFSQVQFQIDIGLDYYIRKKIPVLGPEIKKAYLDRIRDEHRISFFMAVSTEIRYHDDLKVWSQIYERAKVTRDFVCHSMGMTMAWHPTEREWLAAIAHKRGARKNCIPKAIKAETFVRLGNDCAWLLAHVLRVIYEADVMKFIDLTGEAAVPDIPPALPVEGEPIALR